MLTDTIEDAVHNFLLVCLVRSKVGPKLPVASLVCRAPLSDLFLVKRFKGNVRPEHAGEFEFEEVVDRHDSVGFDRQIRASLFKVLFHTFRHHKCVACEQALLESWQQRGLLDGRVEAKPFDGGR